MKNYTNSDYALNKYSDGIVYRFADGIVEVTMSDYLAENPDKTEADFRALKDFSDRDYEQQARRENAQTKKNVGLSELSGFAPSPEELLFDLPDERERKRTRVALAKKALDTLTAVQRRRYVMHHVDGMTLRQIADAEGVDFKSVHESLLAAEKKIKKILGNA